MIDFVILALGQGDFFQNIVMPGIAGAAVFILIAGSIANHFGYRLW